MNIRMGKVNSVKPEAREVRVFFEDVRIMSGWLKVLKNPPIISSTEKAVGGSGENAFAEHSHSIKTASWFPEIGDLVLCIYDNGFNSDGFVLGAV